MYRRVNNIKHADDTMLIAHNLQDLQVTVDSLVRHRRMFELNINVKKEVNLWTGLRSIDDIITLPDAV